MKQYDKIQTVFFRTEESNFKRLDEGCWAKPEFEYLKDTQWEWTEKVDGTNIRVILDKRKVRFKGKTDDAQIATSLFDVLQDTFTDAEMAEKFGAAPDAPVCLYGEGYGGKAGTTHGDNYIKNGCSFILFDVKIGEWWLSRKSVEDIAKFFNVPAVPIIGYGTLLEAVELVKKGYTSTIAENTKYIAEGLIMRPQVQLFNRKGERVITKIKYKDFVR